MSENKIAVKRLVTATFAMLLAACGSAPPTISDKSPVESDQTIFASRKLAPQFLSAAVLKNIPAEAGSPRFGAITITTEVNTMETGGRTETSNVVLRFTNLGQGMMQRASDLSKVGIAFGSTYSLTYKGLVNLKLQEVPLRSSVTRPAIEMKAVSRFDALPSAPGKEFSFDYANGLEYQTSNYLPIQTTCKSGRKVLASTLNAKIPGEALELDCRLSSNNALQSASKWMLLLAYGLAVEVEHLRATSRATTRIVDFSIRT